jgi:hypothetical protein
MTEFSPIQLESHSIFKSFELMDKTGPDPGKIPGLQNCFVNQICLVILPYANKQFAALTVETIPFISMKMLRAFES